MEITNNSRQLASKARGSGVANGQAERSTKSQTMAKPRGSNEGLSPSRLMMARQRLETVTPGATIDCKNACHMF